MKITEFINIKRIWGMIRKEISILVNDRFAMVIIFLIPTILIVSTNFGRGIIEAPRLGLVDLDSSEGSIDSDLSEEFTKLAIEHHEREAIALFLSENDSLIQELLARGKLDAIIIIPRGFEYNISVGYPAIIKVEVDSLNILKFLFTQEKVGELVAEFKDMYNIHGVFNPDFELFLRPKSAGRLFDVAPFFFPWVVFSVGTLVASQTIVSDVPKHRMAMTPTNKFEISLAKIGGIQVLLSALCIELILLSFIFGFQIRSELWIYFFVVWIISLAGVTLGYMLSAFAKTPLAALQFFIFFFLIQVIVMFFIPWEDILYVFPVYNAQFLLQNGVIRGQSVLGIYLNNILLFILTTFFLGYLKYRRIQTLV